MKKASEYPRTHYLNTENRREIIDMIAEEIGCSRGEAKSIFSIVSTCFLKMLSEGKGVSLYRCLGFSFKGERMSLSVKKSQVLLESIRETRERLYPGSRDRILASMSLESLRCLQPKWITARPRVDKRIAEILAARSRLAAEADAAAGDASASDGCATESSQTVEPQSNP